MDSRDVMVNVISFIAIVIVNGKCICMESRRKILRNKIILFFCDLIITISNYSVFHWFLPSEKSGRYKVVSEHGLTSDSNIHRSSTIQIESILAIST